MDISKIDPSKNYHSKEVARLLNLRPCDIRELFEMYDIEPLPLNRQRPLYCGSEIIRALEED